MYNIRNATLDDFNFISNEVAKPFTKHYGIPYDNESVSNTLNTIINNGCIYMCFDNDIFAGALGAVKTKNIWNRNQVVWQEMFWWVTEKYRGTSVGLRLLKQFENAAPKDAAIVLSVLPNTQLKQQTINKLGYSIKEYAFVKG
jgi:hypothetical protein